MARWFGRTWGALICHPDYEVPTPVGTKCTNCPYEFVPGDQGVIIPHLGNSEEQSYYHIDCLTSLIVGPLSKDEDVSEDREQQAQANSGQEGAASQVPSDSQGEAPGEQGCAGGCGQDEPRH